MRHLLLYSFYLFLFLILNACEHAPLSDASASSSLPFNDEEALVDLRHYELDVNVEPSTMRLSGELTATFRLLGEAKHLFLRLDQRLTVHDVFLDEQSQRFDHQASLITVPLPENYQQPLVKLTVLYSGEPYVAENPPWAGGFVWDKTSTGEPWFGTSVQGRGCDLWWPCRDNYRDKADSMTIHITVPSDLVAVANGRLTQTQVLGGNKTRYTWQNTSPISDYNVSISGGPFQKIEKSFQSINGDIVPLEFWALSENIPSATALVEGDVLSQLNHFESLLGPYPWQQDKIGFVDTPYLGMEHQSINGYGNGYKRGKHGFDWLAHHELAHEWFGNLITHKRPKDAWLHEGFAMYLQAIYAEHRYGRAYYQHFMYDFFLNISNCNAVIQEDEHTLVEAFHGDIYFKGAWILHTLRSQVGDEALWNAIRHFLYGTNEPYSLKAPFEPRYRTTEEFLALVETYSGKDYSWLVNTYALKPALPELIVDEQDGETVVRWSAESEALNPLKIPAMLNGKRIEFDLSSGPFSLSEAQGHFILDPDMQILRALPIRGDCDENTHSASSRF